MRRLLVWIVAVVVIVQIAYVAIVNTVLNLPATQTYINQLRPERVTYHWDRAWSWHPFRVHATGFGINGQTWNQQWQLSAPTISASVSLLPLITRTIHLYNVETADIDLRFRPRPSPDLDDADLRPFYPVIEGRDPDSPAEPVPAETPGWLVEYEIVGVGGDNKVWIGPTQMTLSGDLNVTVNRQNLNGPMEIRDGRADLSLKSLAIGGEQVADSGSIAGTFSVASYLPQENRGFKLLAFLSLDAEVELPVEDLQSVDIYLKRVSGLDLAGKGMLKGHVAFDKGDLVPGTGLTITADDLTVDLEPYAAKGAGSVAVSVDSGTPDTLSARFSFATLSAFHEPDGQTLFTGTDLAIDVERTTHILPGAVKAKVPHSIAVTIPQMSVPDISVYQRYIPEKWHAEVVGGSGSLGGHAEIAASSLDFDLTLRSDKAAMRFRDDTFETGLELGVKAKGEADDKAARVDITGSYLVLDDSRLENGGGDTEPWQTRLAVNEGVGDIELPEPDEAAGFVGFWSLFHNRELKAMLGTADARLKADLSVSDLNWVNLLFKNPYSLAIYNSAEVIADIAVSGGWLVEGSTVKMPPRDFRVEILDYVTEGSGGFDLVVEKGGEDPDIRLDAKLANASLRLQDEKTAAVAQATLAVTATATGVSLKGGGAVSTVEMSIPSAKVTDLAAFNVYFPKGSPVRIVSGTADLSAKLDMQEKTAGGFLKMKTSRVEADLDGERLSGVITLDVPIKGGSAQQKSFDISGTSLQLDSVLVSGQHASGSNWDGRVDISKGRVVWKRPMNLDISAGIRMTDARPILAIFEANRRSNRWLDRILDLKDIRGEATVQVAPGEIVIPYSFATSATIDVGAKGIFHESSRQGIFYARYGKLSGILVIDDGQKRFEILGATRKFDDYKPGGPLPGLHEVDAPAAATEGRRFHLFRRR